MSFPTVLEVEINPLTLMGSYPDLLSDSSTALPKARGGENPKSLNQCVTNSVTLIPIFPQWLQRFLGMCHSSQKGTETFPFVVWTAGLWHSSKPSSHRFWLLWLAAALCRIGFISFPILGIDLTSGSKTPALFCLDCWCSKK